MGYPVIKKYSARALWLGFLCLLILIMISVGGVTRLTRSGLSIVEWKPISGIILPLTTQAWQQQFDLYKLSPEYKQVNQHFDLAAYKNIFLWEYSHRLLGRLIFLFVILPGFFLWKKNKVRGHVVLTLAALVALQGLIGWLMVKSGLNIRPHVSHYLLALHFFSALLVLLVAFYHLCALRPPLNTQLGFFQIKSFELFGVLLGLQLFFGCLVSGLRAGIGYNTYPLMNGKVIPEGAFVHKPFWVDFFENPGTVQWVHRWLGLLVFIELVGCLLSLKNSHSWVVLRRPIYHLLWLIFFQILLGILNILYIVPVPLAAFHQFCACSLVLSYFSIAFRMENRT